MLDIDAYLARSITITKDTFCALLVSFRINQKLMKLTYLAAPAIRTSQ